MINVVEEPLLDIRSGLTYSDALQSVASYCPPTTAFANQNPANERLPVYN